MRRLFKKLRRRLDYLDEDRIEQIRQSYLYAFEGHKGQKRRTGEPYITHPVDVACVLAEYKLDHHTIMAALLHDTIEDTFIEKDDIIEHFGVVVANIVDGVSKLDKIHFTSRVEAQAENFRKLVLAMSQDIRVILVKLADRLHNMRTLGTHNSVKRRRISRETLEIFSPIAKRLGMRELSVELEEISFKEMYPLRYKVLQDAIKRARGDRKKILTQIDTTFREGFASEKFPTCQIIGREKHLYSIYRKMKLKRLSFSEIMDVYAFRIVVDDADTCYRVLGLVHRLFKPVPERFKDYIAIPKANGYQSLHTTLFGPYGLPIEVQIRTTAMDRMANQGIAAHWLYKAAEAPTQGITQHSAELWVKNLLEMQHSSASSLEFFENVKVDLFPHEVYVFTPKGEIRSLPAGSTVIDFAYAVHTDVGNHCISARVDRQITTLATVLTNGQTIEIMTMPNARPNPAWLDIVVTGKARHGIRQFMKTRQRSESIALGSDLLKQALLPYDITFKQFSEDAIQVVIDEMHLDSLEDMLEEIGLGNRVASLVAEQMVQSLNNQECHKDNTQPTEPLSIKGTEGVSLSFARCCHPIPGDPIIGILIAGEGVLVHTESCPKLAKLRKNPERVISLRWSQTSEENFPVSLNIEIKNERGALAEIALAASESDANITDIRVAERSGVYCTVEIELHVHDRQHLALVLRRLRRVRSVIKIDRW